jgi:hypothetical protein
MNNALISLNNSCEKKPSESKNRQINNVLASKVRTCLVDNQHYEKHDANYVLTCFMAVGNALTRGRARVVETVHA